GPKTSIICSPMTSLKTSIKTITYLSDIGCLEIHGASLEAAQFRSVSLVPFHQKSTNEDRFSLVLFPVKGTNGRTGILHFH
ncbi:hypothetical protein, partial [Klebsiella pneumoniae]|uniref:hypothetical protein n=1 Tax=Klebsiella pneumoniae TaxID=573 RepID=UPI00301DF176